MQTQNCTHTIIPRRPVAPTYFPNWVKRAARLLHDWSQRSRQRRTLASLNDTALRDIGLTRDDVRREVAKPFWQL